jgi:hypothetical protein
MVLIFKIRTITPPHDLNSKNIFLVWIRMMAAISDFKLGREPAVLATKTQKACSSFSGQQITNFNR